MEFLFVFFLGAFGYGALETLWRGGTHWTMLPAGGLCFLLIYLTATRMRCPLWQTWLLSAAEVTTVELLTGLLVNRALGWAVWDYAALPLNLGGQICLRYSLYWLALSVPAAALSRAVRRFLFPARRRALRGGWCRGDPRRGR